MGTRKILGINALVCLVTVGVTVAPADAQTTALGGLHGFGDQRRPQSAVLGWRDSDVPPRSGTFRFPSPDFTQGVRVTNASDCGGTDCVRPVGYSNRSNSNNHVGSDTMLIFLGLERRQGGGRTGRSSATTSARVKCSNDGPLFPSRRQPLQLGRTGEGWDFSAKQPTMLYVNLPATSTLQRYDVVSHALTTVFDVASRPDPLLATNRYIWQFHSSDDDRVHSATLKDEPELCRSGAPGVPRVQDHQFH